jgi:protein ImuA
MNMSTVMLPAEPMEQHLRRLRRVIAESEAQGIPEAERRVALGVAAIDTALGGGLAGAALHEVSATLPLHFGAAAGFALALAALIREPQKQTLWIATDFSCLEAGVLYGPGLDQFGLPTERLLVARVARPVDALFAMEEALKCRALSTVIAELHGEADLTATRRLSLAAREGGALGLLLRHKPSAAPSAAHTRWQAATAPSEPDELGGLGRTALTLSLTRNRRGPCGRWTIAWDHHEHAFAALSRGVAEAARDRPDRAPLIRTG